jgi:spire-like protein
MTGIVKGQRFPERSNDHDLWSHPMECLKLTVQELSHIRQVFSRAEIEKYSCQTALYKLLSKELICLNCKIQKFNWMTWPCTCDVCKAKVCKKCARKVSCGAEDPLEAPVYTLVLEDGNHGVSNSKKTKMIVCDPCIELISHIHENARRALEARAVIPKPKCIDR